MASGNKVQMAHAVLAPHCQTAEGVLRGGMALGSDILKYLTDRAIKGAQALAGTNYPSKQKFKGHQVITKVSINSSGYSLAIMAKDNVPFVDINGLLFDVAIYIIPKGSNDETLMHTVTFSYPSIQAQVVLVDRRFGFQVGSVGSESQVLNPKDEWKEMQELPDGSAFDAAGKDKWKTLQAAITLICSDAIAASMVESIEVPNVLDMFVGIEFNGPFSVGAGADMILVAGELSFVDSCSRNHANVSVGMSQMKDGASNVLTSNQNIDYKSDIEKVDYGDLFLHLPQEIMRKRFEGVVKPSVSFTNNGNIGPIHWHYETTLAPDSQNPLTLTLQRLWPTEFLLNVPAVAFGVSGAGIKVGCVYLEAGGISFTGRVDRLEVYFTITLDASANEIVFQSRLGRVDTSKWGFSHSPTWNQFPFDQVADFILAKVAEHLATKRSEKILNTTRVALMRFALMDGFGQLENTMSAETDVDAQAVTIGVSFIRPNT